MADADNRVHGCYALAAGAVSHASATRSVRRNMNMPDPVPVLVPARLALDRRAQGMKSGAALLQGAVRRTVAVSQNAAVRTLRVHSLHDRARQFHERGCRPRHSRRVA